MCELSSLLDFTFLLKEVFFSEYSSLHFARGGACIFRGLFGTNLSTSSFM